MTSRRVTVLTAKAGLKMTKTFTPEGVHSYDRAKYFQPVSHTVSGLRELAALLSSLEGQPSSCVIRGQFKGREAAAAHEGGVDPSAKGYFSREKALYNDEPLHWVMLDVDNYEPRDGIDPILQPRQAVYDYIDRVLPAEFQEVSCYWQLSASAGQPSAKGKLKAHIWFWLKTPYDSVQMTAWAKSVSPLIDVAPLRTVQVHYTANPVYQGVPDPVPPGNRSDLLEGVLGDVVPLVISDAVLLRAYERFGGEASDYEFKDPAEKPGVVGAFHRAYSVEEVIAELLPDEFLFEDGSDRRVTWLNGGGTPGGCFVTDDRQHFGSTHNTDPFDNRVVNLFDLVRGYRFGHLDEGHDQFEILEMRDKPSYQAMVDWCMKDRRVQEQMDEEKKIKCQSSTRIRDSLIESISLAETESGLKVSVASDIQKKFKELLKVDFDQVALEFQAKLKSITGNKVTLAAVKDLITPPKSELQHSQLFPSWAHGYYFVTSYGRIYRYDSDEWLDRTSFEFLHNRDAGLNENGKQISAFDFLRDHPEMPVVAKALYLPNEGSQFIFDGADCVNTYRPSSVPLAKMSIQWTIEEKKAIKKVMRHIEILCSNRTNLSRALIDWLAHCVQRPGVKMRYAWLIWGGEGVGKTFIGKMMESVLGSQNIRNVAVRDVLSPTFNGWAEGKVLSIIEEIRIPGHKKDAWENLKEPLSNDRISITKKGVDPYDAPNMTNYMMFSNHHDAVPVSLGSRRVAVINVPFNGDETKQQLDAMAISEGYKNSGEYFDELFSIVKEYGPALRGWLLEWKFSPDFDPQGWAPESEDRAIMASTNVADDEELAQLVINEGAWLISPSIVNPKTLVTAIELWDDGGIQITPERASHILAKLGYKKYPKPLRFEGKLTRFWIKGIILTGNTEADNQLIKAAVELTKATAKNDCPV